MRHDPDEDLMAAVDYIAWATHHAIKGMTPEQVEEHWREMRALMESRAAKMADGAAEVIPAPNRSERRRRGRTR